MHKALSQQWGTGEMAELSGALTALPDPSSVFTTHAGEPEPAPPSMAPEMGLRGSWREYRTDKHLDTQER